MSSDSDEEALAFPYVLGTLDTILLSNLTRLGFKGSGGITAHDWQTRRFAPGTAGTRRDRGRGENRSKWRSEVRTCREERYVTRAERRFVVFLAGRKLLRFRRAKEVRRDEESQSPHSAHSLRNSYFSEGAVDRPGASREGYYV
jgi:hypothetical protein